MARKNLEENIRDKMRSRELQPSAGAWEKLAAQLEEEPKVRSMRGWYYVAASVVALLMLGTIFYNQNDIKVEPQIGVEEVEVNPINDEKDRLIPQLKENSSLAIENTINEEMETDIAVSVKDPKTARPKSTNRQTEIIDVLTDDGGLEDLDDEVDRLLNQKVQEVASTIQSLQDEKGDVTIQEVEALLDNARREIFLERTLKNSQVDATALLQEVEWELDKSFYDKVFETLGDGFKRIATAYTERND